MKQGFIYIHDNIFPTLLALSAEEQAIGLMHQPFPPPVMSFIYPRPQINKFWMHQTPSPLDIIFCHNGKVSQICKGDPYSTRVIGSEEYSDLVVELPYGTAAVIGLKLGHTAELFKPNRNDLKRLMFQNF